MQPISLTKRILYSVDKITRKIFPDDFGNRCMYQAYAIQILASQNQLECTILSGDFCIFAVTKDNRTVSFQGFGNNTNTSSHFWCEIDGYVTDLGPIYLSHMTNGLPLYKNPIVLWPKSESFPNYLRFRAKAKFGHGTPFSNNPEFIERAENFVSECDKSFKKINGAPTFRHPFLSGSKSTIEMARKGNLWAKAAIRMTTMPELNPPF